MTVYKADTLKNIYIRQQAARAARKKIIPADVLQAIVESHPVDLFMPNVFVQIGLAILTLFITLCGIGLIALLTDFGSGVGAFLIVMGILCYIFLEVMTGAKKHYNSGVDNLLLVATTGFITGGFLFMYQGAHAEIASALIVAMLCIWFAIRFADRVAAGVAAIALLTFVFNSYVSLGEFTIGSFPYLMIAAAALLYYFSTKKATVVGYSVYQPAWQVVSVVGLLAFYFAGNFYVVAQLSESSYLLQKNSALSAAWFLWLWTLVIPVAILLVGIKQKNIVLLRAGILLSAIAVVTFRYYYHILPTEAAMIVAGVLLIGSSYLLMQYLRQAKGGFVFDKNNKEESDDFAALAIDQIIAGSRPAHAKTKFEGGDFGGGGAGSNF